MTASQSPSGRPARRRPSLRYRFWPSTAAILAIFVGQPAVAQQGFVDPFAGSAMPGAPGPYGADLGSFGHLLQTVFGVAPTMLAATGSIGAITPFGPVTAGQSMAATDTGG